MPDSLQSHGLQHTRLPCPPVSLGLAQTHAHWVSEVGHSTISSCCPLLLLPSSFPRIRLFSDEPVLCIRWSKYWSFRFSISPSNEYSGLISCRIEWLDLLAVQGTVTSLLQHHSSEASFSVFSFLYGPILTSVHDYWNNITFSKLGFLVKWLTALWRLIKGICWYCVLCQSVIIRRAKSELFQG